MKRMLSAWVVCACLSMPVIAGPTGTITMNYLGLDAAPYSTVSLYADAGGTYPPYDIAYGGGVVAGYYKHDVSAATGSGLRVADPMLGFCIDLSQPPSYLAATYDVVPLTEAPTPTLIGTPITAAKADMLAELWGRHYSPAMTGQQAAQFQLAVWEIVFETSGVYNISTGSIRSNDFNLGTNMLLNSLNGTGPMANLVALTNPQYQDMVTSVTVPVPGAVGLGGIGVAVIGWLRSRKRL
jgi:hypothetical protein